MDEKRTNVTKRIVGMALAATAVLGLLGAAGASAAPKPAPRPLLNGITRSAALALADDGPTGDCKTSVTNVTCKPDVGGSCTGYSSQTTPPATIRVYDATYTGANHIRTVPFETYVEDVLPNEWADSWDGDALKAGAVAITSYAWYWVTHFGGYVGTNSPSTCFDVTDDQNFQVFVNGSAKTNSTAKVRQVFPSAIRVGGAVLQASYFSALNLDTYDVTKPSTYDACGQGADGKFLSQSGSQTCNEDNTANKWPVILRTYYGPNIQLATTAQLRAQHDFQYLHRSTEATFNAGTWSINDGYPTSLRFGLTGDVPVVNTVGDGFARVGVYRPSNRTWYLGGPTGLPVRASFSFGLAGDAPVAAQYQSLSAPTQVAVWRPSNGTWYFAGPAGGTVSTIQYGRRGDVPVPGRWSSSTADSVAIFRPSTRVWYIRGAASVHSGLQGDVPVPADYTGDGRTDIAVYRPSNHNFYVRGQAAPVHWGVAGDVPVTGDFNGDGKADFALYRPSNHTWYVRNISTSTFGSSGVTPIGKAPYAG